MEPVIKKPHFKSESNLESESLKLNSITKNLLYSKSPQNISNQKISSSLSRNNFEFIYIIGKGGFGKVWRVKEKKTKKLYALKEMSKTKIIDKKSEKSINGEREFLSFLHHPFIVNMHYAFQDSDNLYLVMDLLTGGDLRYHCSRYRIFSEEQTRFFLACIIHSLNYIHKNNVIHRDIKPENLVLDDKGYVCITDFGVAKKNMKDNSSETSGTPGYMCPEVINGKNHSFPADFFSIGVIGYEFMMGKRPYQGRGRKEIKEQIKKFQAKITKEEMKDGWSIEGVEFINALLERSESKRLGYHHGVKELKEHPWLKYYPWKDLSKKILPAPFVPENIDNFDKKYCESADEISDETQLRYDEIILCTHYNTVFENFYFNKDEVKRDEINYESNDEISDYNESINNYDESNKKYRELNKEINEINNNIKKNSDLIIKTKEQIFAIDNTDKELINNGISAKNNLNPNIIKKDINYETKKENNNNFSVTDKSNKILNNLLIKNRNKSLINKRKYILPKNKSYISLMQNSLRKENLQNLNPNSNLEENKTNHGFINIKKIFTNTKNTLSKITNQRNNINIKDKFGLFKNRQNKIDKLKNMRKVNSHINNNVFNINSNDIQNMNNNSSNINIYLSINMFNKMLNNHYYKNKKFNNERYIMQDLLNKQKQLIIKDNKKKFLDNYLNQGNKKKYFVKNNNKVNNINVNKISRSNSVGLLLNHNILNAGKANNNKFFVNKINI